MMEALNIALGYRFVCDGHYGTVRYIGPVPPTEGTWLGVEWDDSSRGKHDGTHNGKSYFKTRLPNCGSFVRPTKVDFGISCLSAIHQQYGQADVNSDAKKMQENLYISIQDNKILPVDVVGVEKIHAKQSLINLREVVLINMKVSSAGQEGELKNAVPNISILDLSKNLLNSWEEVAKITQQLHYLKNLNLSNNQLALPDDPVTLKEAFSILEVIILMRMNYSWPQIHQCSQMWPYLLHLVIPFNVIQTLDIPEPDRLMNLEHLDMEGNCIEQWSEVQKLGHLPKLKWLNLNNNRISSIVFIDVAPCKKTQLFMALETLYLENNSIKQWSDINELNKLPSLNQLNINDNPLWKSEKRDDVWQLVIAKIDGLKILNRCSISPKERRGAELDYLKKYGKEWLLAEKSSIVDLKAHFLTEHPRYHALVEAHGAPEESELKCHSSALKNTLITLNISCPKVDNCKPVVKKLPGTMTVQKVRSLVQRMFKAEKQDVVMKCKSNKKVEHLVQLDNDLRELAFYVEDGDQIIVDW